MREIKFRAWDKEEREFINIKSFGFLEDGEVWYVQAIDGSENEINPPYFTGESDLAIMQFTGLKDKNGMEIYEGDIYDNGLRKFVVKYDEERAGFFPFAKDDGCGCCSDEVVWHPESDEVIGNIYENPELLEKDQHHD